MNEYTITMRLYLPLLLRQKQALLRAIAKADVCDAEFMDGILNLLDHIHDTIDPANPSPALIRAAKEQWAREAKEREDAQCRQGLHSWIDEIGKLPADTKCTRCGEPYGNVK